MSTTIDPHAAAQNNPSVDPKKLEEVEHIRRILESAGVLKKADYRLAPPLGKGQAPEPHQSKVRISRK